MILNLIHSVVFGTPTLVLILLAFLFLNLNSRFIGIRKIGAAIKAVFKSDSNSGINSPVSAAFVSLSATVGTGNIVGVAGAITLGGPGAVFWMWISALLAMTVKFSEIYLSSLFKKEGSVYSYIYKVIKSDILRRTFLIFGIIAAVSIGNLTQTNAAATAAAIALDGISASNAAVRFFLGAAFFAASFLLLKREAAAVRFCEKFLPLMAAFYIILCAAALFRMREAVGGVFLQIIKGAFCPRAVTAGAVGSVVKAIKPGVARGVFSNEAGLSTAAIAYEKNSAEPEKAALFGIFEVFVDTIVLCSLTALVVLSSGTVTYGEDLGAYTTLCAFIGILGKRSLPIFCLVVCFFAFSSVIGWGVYVRRFAEKLKISPAIILPVYCAVCMPGAVFKTAAVWQIAEMGSIFMMSINCTALIKHRESLSYKQLRYKYRGHGKK